MPLLDAIPTPLLVILQRIVLAAVFAGLFGLALLRAVRHRQARARHVLRTGNWRTLLDDAGTLDWP